MGAASPTRMGGGRKGIVRQGTAVTRSGVLWMKVGGPFIWDGERIAILTAFDDYKTRLLWGAPSSQRLEGLRRQVGCVTRTVDKVSDIQRTSCRHLDLRDDGTGGATD